MLSGSELQGESYSAFRDRVRSLRLPLVEAHRAAFDVMYACNGENVAKVSTLPETSPGIADTDEAQAKIERLQELNQAYMRLIDADPPGTSNDAVRSVEGAIRVNEDLIASLRDVIYQIEDYAARSVGIYARARSAVDVLREAGASVKSCLVGNGYGSRGRMALPRVTTSWWPRGWASPRRTSSPCSVISLASTPRPRRPCGTSTPRCTVAIPT